MAKLQCMPLVRGRFVLAFFYLIMNVVLLGIAVHLILERHTYGIPHVSIKMDYMLTVYLVLNTIATITASVLLYGLFKKIRNILKFTVNAIFTKLVFHACLILYSIDIIVDSYGWPNIVNVNCISVSIVIEAGIELLVALVVRSAYIKMGGPGEVIVKQPPANPTLADSKELALEVRIATENGTPPANPNDPTSSSVPTAPQATPLYQPAYPLHTPYQLPYVQSQNDHIYPSISTLST